MRGSQLLSAGLAGNATGVAAACNGHDALCDKRFSEITLVGSHNSAFVGTGPSHNQYVSPTEQLDMGVRFLQARTQDKSGHPQMCHSSCLLLDVGPLEDYLEEVEGWLSDNPDEVLALLITNNDGLPISKFGDAFEETGLNEYAFNPEGTLAKDEWPTLQELIDDGKRLIVFTDQGADRDEVDFILNEWDYYWETPFGETDPDFPTCEMDRPDDGDSGELMMMINHFLNIELPLGVKVPDQGNAETTNSLDSITEQATRCQDEVGERANVILLDWIDVGEAMEAQDELNDL